LCRLREGSDDNVGVSFITGPFCNGVLKAANTYAFFTTDRKLSTFSN